MAQDAMRGGMLLLVVIYTTLVLTIRTAQGADPVFTPVNVTDSAGNFADLNSTVSWAAIPAGLAYKTTATYNDGGLAPFFNLAKSFIYTIMPGSFPYDLLLGLTKGTFNIGQDYMTIVNYAVGFAVCVVIGFLYIFIMPIVGCCFCCFRCCCGACGGDMKRKRKDTDNCYRISFSIVLAILSLFIFVGVMCLYVTNDRVSSSLTSLTSIIETNLDDIELFLNNTVSEIIFLTSDSFSFATLVISRDLDNIGYLVGIPVRDTLSTEGGVSASINSIIALDTNISVAGAMLLALNTSIGNIQTDAATLTTDLASAKADVDAGTGACSTAGCNAIDSSLIAMDVDFNNLPNITANVVLMQTVLSKNLTAMALDGKKQFDDIPEQVTNDTKTVVADIKGLLSNFTTTIAGVASQITGLPTMVQTSLSPIKSSLNTYTSMITPYDNYRRYGGIGLACIVLLVVVLQIVGVLLGFCGYDNDKEAHERSGLSNVAGNILMAASGFIFIFASLLMLLTVLLFLVGGLMEKVLCQPLADPSYTIFKRLIDGPGGLLGTNPNGYFLGGLLLQDDSINLTFSGALEGCKANGGAFSVLRLDALFDLTTVTDYKKSIDIQSQIDAINVDLTTVDLISTNTEQQLRDFVSAVDIDYAAFRTELQKSTTKTDLAAMASSLSALAADGSTPSGAQASFTSAAGKLNAINSGIYATVNNAKTQMLADVNALEAEVANTPTGVNATIDAAQAVENYIGLNGTSLIKTTAATYGNRILGTADSFANAALTKVQNDVAGCLPVYNVFNSLFLIGICGYIVDILNGFWLSLGWILFFETIAVIFDIKLAKFLRRMKEPDDDEASQHSSSSSLKKQDLNEEEGVVVAGGTMVTKDGTEVAEFNETEKPTEDLPGGPGVVVAVGAQAIGSDPNMGSRQATQLPGAAEPTFDEAELAAAPADPTSVAGGAAEMAPPEVATTAEVPAPPEAEANTERQPTLVKEATASPATGDAPPASST